MIERIFFREEGRRTTDRLRRAVRRVSFSSSAAGSRSTAPWIRTASPPARNSSRRCGAIPWRRGLGFRDSERAAIARWQKTATAFSAKRPFIVRLFRMPRREALYTGSRPADVLADGARIRVDIDASRRQGTGSGVPVLAAAGLAVLDPAALEHPRPCFWRRAPGSSGSGGPGRPGVRGVHAGGEGRALDRGGRPFFGRRVAGSGRRLGGLVARRGRSPRGRKGGDEGARPRRSGPGRAAVAVARCGDAAAVVPRATAPALGFLRGVSYAHDQRVETRTSRRALETLRRLKSLSVSSISVMPLGFSPDAKAERIALLHGSPVARPTRGRCG